LPEPIGRRGDGKGVCLGRGQGVEGKDAQSGGLK